MIAKPKQHTKEKQQTTGGKIKRKGQRTTIRETKKQLIEWQ